MIKDFEQFLSSMAAEEFAKRLEAAHKEYKLKYNGSSASMVRKVKCQEWCQLLDWFGIGSDN